jgi:hypothetical protein
MRCLVCGRASTRGEHERNIRSLLIWLLACAFALGIAAGAALCLVLAGFL